MNIREILRAIRDGLIAGGVLLLLFIAIRYIYGFVA